MVGTAFWLSSYIPVNKNFEPGPPPRVLARDARDILRHKGLERFQPWATQLKSRHNVEFFLFNSENSLVFSTEASPFADAQWPALLKEMKLARRHGVDRGGRNYFISRARPINAADEPPLIARIVVSTPSARGEFARLFIRNAGIRFGIAVIISGLICYWLARYFTVPIKRMRAAMKTVADGDYSVRTMQHAASRNDELTLLAQDFDRMTEKVQQTLSSQARLIKDVSHELRSPLARLQVALGLAQQKMNALGTESGVQNIDAELQKIDDEVHVIDELVEQILSLPQRDLSLPDAVDLLGVIEHCISDALQTNNEASIEFSSDTDEALVATNGRLLLSVFDNIIANAVRYTPLGKVITIHLSRHQTLFTVTITDAGPGVDPSHLPHLFEPFYRASNARERHTGGHGLGLAIAQRNVLLHGGSINAINALDDEGQTHGLQVRVELPEKTS